jgi:hypothetical protein
VVESKSGSASVGGEVTFRAELDPSDPRVQAQLRSLVENPGNPGALRSLMGLSEAQVSVNTTASTSADYTLGGTGLETSGKSTNAVVTYVKPPGGAWVSM